MQPENEQQGTGQSDIGQPAAVPPEINRPEIVPSEVESPGPKPKLWGAWATIGFGAAAFAVYFIAQSIVAIAFIVGQLVTSPESGSLGELEKLVTNGDMISIATILSAIFGVGFIILFIKIRKGSGILEYLGLKSFSKKTFFILLAIVVGLLVLSSVLDQVLHVPQDTGFTVDAYKSATIPALLWVAVIVFAPAFEECFFRGFVFVGLKQSPIGAAGTIALTSITWALLHIQYDAYGMVTILVLGIVFGIVRLKTGSLWSTLILHSLWNAVAMVGTYLVVNGIGQ